MSSHAIRLFACITMLCDHVGYCMQVYRIGDFELASILRIIGRLAMPLFAFLIAEGFKKTHNVFLYMLRMLLAALVSEIPFNLMSSGRIYDRSSQNVMFTLLLGLLALYMVDLARKSKSKHLKIYAFIPILFFCYLAGHFSVDYNFYGVLLILLFYFLDTSSVETRIWFLPALALFASRYIILAYWNGAPVRDWDVTQLYELFCIVPILLYSGKKGYTPKSRAGRFMQKTGFYLFYPAHMAALYFIFHYWSHVISFFS